MKSTRRADGETIDASAGISIGARRESSGANTEKHRKGKQRGVATSRSYKYCATSAESKGKHRAPRRRVFRYLGRTTADSRAAVADRRRFASPFSAGTVRLAAWQAGRRVPRARSSRIIRERRSGDAQQASRANELFSSFRAVKAASPANLVGLGRGERSLGRVAS